MFSFSGVSCRQPQVDVKPDDFVVVIACGAVMYARIVRVTSSSLCVLLGSVSRRSHVHLSLSLQN
jgi:hypothetical protein